MEKTIIQCLNLQEKQLGNDRVGHGVINLGADEDDSIQQQSGVDVVCALSLVCLFNDGGDVVILRSVHNLYLCIF